MKYYIVADLHGFLDKLKESLREAGFFEDEQPHKLIVCGDVLDRGQQAVEMVDFLVSLAERDQLIFVRGNHEDLFLQCMLEIAYNGAVDIALGMSRHHHNRTWDTLLQLSGMSEQDAVRYPRELLHAVMSSPFYRTLLPMCVDYYETAGYVFCHGWIPTANCAYDESWRQASFEEWQVARWSNGMAQACKFGITEPGKTIVCGHFHASYGHAKIAGECSEWGEDADFSPFYADGIIALDACTAYSGRMNCIVIEDQEAT